MKKIVITSLGCILVDQIIKLLIVNNLVLNNSLTIIKNFFSLTYAQNTGAAFSILSGNIIFLICITIMALVFIYLFLIKNEKKSFNLYLYGILYGGIIGNLIDRIFRGYVVDYLDFNLFGYNFPIFNFADICIVVSIGLIVILSFLEAKNGKN